MPPVVPQAKYPKHKSLKLLAAALCAGLLLTAAGCTPRGQGPVSTPTPTPTAAAPTPVVTPTPVPVPTFDFSLPAPETEPVTMGYFADALFIGDSRTDGLQLYSGIKDTTFHCYTGLTILEVQDKPFVELNGEKLSVVEALGRQQYAKIYVSLGINELGFYDDQLFEDSFRTFLRQIKQLQPDAVIYLENLVPVNPEKCSLYDQPYYVTNKQVAVYNDIFARLAPEEQVVLLDVASALSNEEGILAPENTVDGVHYTKAWYKTWLDFLMTHTVDPVEYQAGQDISAPAEGAVVNEG